MPHDDFSRYFRRHGFTRLPCRCSTRMATKEILCTTSISWREPLRPFHRRGRRCLANRVGKNCTKYYRTSLDPLDLIGHVFSFYSYVILPLLPLTNSDCSMKYQLDHFEQQKAYSVASHSCLGQCKDFILFVPKETLLCYRAVVRKSPCG